MTALYTALYIQKPLKGSCFTCNQSTPSNPAMVYTVAGKRYCSFHYPVMLDRILAAPVDGVSTTEAAVDYLNRNTFVFPRVLPVEMGAVILGLAAKQVKAAALTAPPNRGERTRLLQGVEITLNTWWAAAVPSSPERPDLIDRAIERVLDEEAARGLVYRQPPRTDHCVGCPSPVAGQAKKPTYEVGVMMRRPLCRRHYRLFLEARLAFRINGRTDALAALAAVEEETRLLRDERTNYITEGALVTGLVANTLRWSKPVAVGVGTIIDQVIGAIRRDWNHTLPVAGRTYLGDLVALAIERVAAEFEAAPELGMDLMQRPAEVSLSQTCLSCLTINAPKDGPPHFTVGSASIVYAFTFFSGDRSTYYCPTHYRKALANQLNRAPDPATAAAAVTRLMHKYPSMYLPEALRAQVISDATLVVGLIHNLIGAAPTSLRVERIVDIVSGMIASSWRFGLAPVPQLSDLVLLETLRAVKREPVAVTPPTPDEAARFGRSPWLDIAGEVNAAVAEKMGNDAAHEMLFGADAPKPAWTLPESLKAFFGPIGPKSMGPSRLKSPFTTGETLTDSVNRLTVQMDTLPKRPETTAEVLYRACPMPSTEKQVLDERASKKAARIDDEAIFEEELSRLGMADDHNARSLTVPAERLQAIARMLRGDVALATATYTDLLDRVGDLLGRTDSITATLTPKGAAR